MKKISVIVPVYNTEKLLSRCLDSIIHQKNISPDEYEIIIVNDGSPDNSQEVINNYSEKFPTIIKAVWKENGGLPSARNYGLNFASGEYICFIDSDDYIEKNMFDELYNLAISKKLDIARGNFCNVYLNGKIEKNPYFVEAIDTMSGADYYISEMRSLRQNMKNMVWMSLYHRSLFFEQGIRFEENPRIFEDIVFNAVVLSKAERVAAINVSLYNYVQYQKSITNSLVVEKSQETFISLSKELQRISDNQTDQNFIDALQDYGTYVAIFALKILHFKVNKNQELAKQLRGYNFKKESKLRKILLSINPMYLSYYLWILEYGARVKKKLKSRSKK